MAKVMVTGATGLIGSAVCAELRAHGDDVRALVRPGSDHRTLDELGVDVVTGDVGDRDDVLMAVAGCQYAIHCAALVTGGVAEHGDEDYELVNVHGSANVFDAAQEHGVERVVSFTSGPDPRRVPVPDTGIPGDPYFTTKVAVARDVVRRSGNGENIVEISPGATYGAAPSGRRATTPPGFNSRIVRAVRGELTAMPLLWLSFNTAEDVARTTRRALTAGTSGQRYDLGARPGDEVGTVAFLNVACEVAGVRHRVRAMTADELDDEQAVNLFGPTIVTIAKATAAGSARRAAAPGQATPAMSILGHDPIDLRPAMERTIAWMRKLALV